jgi:hypothetical protein
VVVDSRWRRVKVKSPLYVAIHHILNNISSEKRIIDLIVSGEDAEVASYFPEYAVMFGSLRERIDTFITHNERELETIRNAGYATQKELAGYVTRTVCPSCLFYVMKGKVKSVRDFIYNMPANRMIAYLDKFQNLMQDNSINSTQTE